MRLNRVSMILFLGFLVVALVSVNVFLYSKLQYKESFIKEGKLVTIKDLLPKKQEFNNLPTDSSGQYKIEANFLLSKIRPEKRKPDLALVTHCTSNHLHYLLDLTVHWKGPISLAVFVPGYDVITTYTSLLGLHQCVQRFRDHVTVHLVYPLSHPPAENTLGPYLEQALHRLRSCNEFITRLNNNELSGERSLNYANVQVPYPNNLLRNVGRSSVLPGHYVFVVDVDMMCNRNLYQGFLGLAKQLNLFAKNNGNTIIIFYLYCCANST